MSVIESVRQHADEMIAIRRDLHSHPETAFEEHRTVDLIARRLSEWGWKVKSGTGATGVVGTLSAGHGRRSIMIRADIDALPMQEDVGLAWASRNRGRMHACGHDGHTAILLAAARHLADTKEFSGTVHVVFQPAEEIVAGARRMVDEGLFKEFPADHVYGLHNIPSMAAGSFGFHFRSYQATSTSAIMSAPKSSDPRPPALCCEGAGYSRAG
jgi:hippurate hydrolase